MIDGKEKLRKMFLKVAGRIAPTEEDIDIKKYEGRVKKAFPGISNDNARHIASGIVRRHVKS